MATQVQFRRGTRAQGLAFTGAAGEATVDADRGSKSGRRWRIHDGAVAGGFLQASIADLQELEGVYGTAIQGGSPDSPDELVLTHTEAILGYTEGLQIAWKQPADNTGAVQVNVDGKGFKDIRKNHSSGTPLDLAAEQVAYGGFQLFDVLLEMKDVGGQDAHWGTGGRLLFERRDFWALRRAHDWAPPGGRPNPGGQWL